jgi:hypothetical protein
MGLLVLLALRSKLRAKRKKNGTLVRHQLEDVYRCAEKRDRSAHWQSGDRCS